MRQSRFHTWVHDHPQVVDALGPAFALVPFGLFYLVSVGSTGASELLTVLFIAPLALRRRFPFATALLVAAVCLLQLALTGSPHVGDIAVWIVIYSVAGHCRTLWKRRTVLALAILGCFAGPARWTWMPGSPLMEHATRMLFLGVFLLLSVAVCWVLGESVRFRQSLMERLEEQNQALARDQEQRAALAAQGERTAIAREMHDIVAHSLAVVVVQADGGAYTSRQALESRPEDTALRRAAETLETVAAQARAALAETRQLVGVLRDGNGPAEYAPVTGLDQVPELVDHLRAVGRAAELRATGELAAVPRDAGLAAYRIVQEALTNVLRHAGPAAAATVTLTAAPGALHVEVRDDGDGPAAPADGAGHGIIGMRERAAALGGSLHAGPSPGGGFTVTATLPFTAPDQAAPAAPPVIGPAPADAQAPPDASNPRDPSAPSAEEMPWTPR